MFIAVPHYNSKSAIRNSKSVFLPSPTPWRPLFPAFIGPPHLEPRTPSRHHLSVQRIEGRAFSDNLLASPRPTLRPQRPVWLGRSKLR